MKRPNSPLYATALFVGGLATGCSNSTMPIGEPAPTEMLPGTPAPEDTGNVDTGADAAPELGAIRRPGRPLTDAAKQR